ncbi:MAG: hypothetical protein H7Y22_13225 [Gemmatimonadaceae bacterium]|nr:hypothetical protein [Gloeobacterales cyanobacterium ES-bin-141]
MAIQTSLPGYFTPEEIAEWIGTTPKCVKHKLTGRGNKQPSLRGYKPGGEWYVPQKEALRFIFKYLCSQGSAGEVRLLNFSAELPTAELEELNAMKREYSLSPIQDLVAIAS